MPEGRKHGTPPTRREPKTQRGRDTRDEILIAARKLLCERWAQDVPFTELAAAAGVARASLLYAYPHWRNVMYDLLIEEILLVGTAFEKVSKRKRLRPERRAYLMLVPLLDQAERTGLLYPNLRSAMFTWHAEPSEEEQSLEALGEPPGAEMLGHFILFMTEDLYVGIEELLGLPTDASQKPGKYAHPVGEALVNFAFDLAAGSPSYCSSFDERRRTLRSTIEMIAMGLAKSR